MDSPNVAQLKNNVENARSYLEEIRINKKNEPLVVAAVGKKLIENNYSKLGDNDRWIILEQVYVVALETGDLVLSKKCLSLLTEKFTSSSVRVRRLEAMQFEASGDIEKATKIYDRLLKDDTDNATMKRKICVLLEKGLTSDAITSLTEYLQVFMADLDAWSELADLYLKEQMYKQAVFCYEELILADPQNYHYYTKCAEIKYTMGGGANLLDAIYYYSFSLELSTVNNNRSLFGVCLAVNQLKNISGKDAVTKEMKGTLAEAKKRLTAIYEKESPQNLKPVLAILDSLAK